jgi:CDP-diacylglycerol pyrophosphatase
MSGRIALCSVLGATGQLTRAVAEREKLADQAPNIDKDPPEMIRCLFPPLANHNLSGAILRLLIFSAACGAVLSPCQGQERLKLWHLVHDECVPDQTVSHNPAPCDFVDVGLGERDGYAIKKDDIGSAQFLLIPTRQIGGIENPEILASDAPNYFKSAWDARKYVIERIGHDLPRSAIGLAINSEYARTQDQLHIHIDCVRPDVAAQIGAHVTDISHKWTELPVDLMGQRYLALQVQSSDLDGMNPFQMLAAGMPEARADMSHETLVVIGTESPQGKPGFILLAGRADSAARQTGHGEDLLDHDCAIANVQK